MLISDMKGNKEKGFTLIETLIAMVILAIALLGIAQMQLSAMRGNRSSYDMTEASAIASDFIEQMTTQNSKDPTTVACPPNDAVTPYNITYTRQCVLPAGTTGQRMATVTVSWRGENVNRQLIVTSPF